MESIYSEGSENTRSEKGEEADFQSHVNQLIQQIRKNKELHVKEKIKLQNDEKEKKKKEEFLKKQIENKFTMDLHARPQMKTGAKINYFEKFKPLKGKILSPTEQYRVMLTAKSYKDPKRDGKSFRYTNTYAEFFSRTEEGGRAYQRPLNVTEIKEQKALERQKPQTASTWIPTNTKARFFSIPPVDKSRKEVNQDIKPFQKLKPFKRTQPYGRVFAVTAASII